MLILLIGWLCAPGRGYMTVYEGFSAFMGVLVIVYTCAFMDFSQLRTGACLVPVFCISFRTCTLIHIIGWLCAPGREYMTVYDRFSVFTDVLVIVYASAFMVLSELHACTCDVLVFRISFCIFILIHIVGWLCAPERGYMTVYDRSSAFLGVLVIVYTCVFMGSLCCVQVPVLYLFSAHHSYMYIDTNNCLVVRAWAWVHDCI